jgi:serine/threonine protein phosphatase PrpC
MRLKISIWLRLKLVIRECMSRIKLEFRIGTASAMGPLHIKEGTANQDSYAFFRSRQIIAVAVADGLGSAPHSDEGSNYAVHVAVGQLMHYLYSYGKSKSKIPNITVLRERIIQSWQHEFEPPAEYDTTLLFVGISPKVCVIGQIGDGLILYKRAKSPERFDVFLEPPKEYLNQPESSLAQPTAREFLHIKEWCLSSTDMFSSFLLMTDGIADDLHDAALYANDILKKLETEPNREWNAILDKHLGDWPTPGHYDDKTLVVMKQESGTAIQTTPDFNTTDSTLIPSSTDGENQAPTIENTAEITSIK